MPFPQPELKFGPTVGSTQAQMGPSNIQGMFVDQAFIHYAGKAAPFCLICGGVSAQS